MILDLDYMFMTFNMYIINLSVNISSMILIHHPHFTKDSCNISNFSFHVFVYLKPCSFFCYYPLLPKFLLCDDNKDF